MDLFLKFKRDYFNYLISIILPALITGISIPVFKHLLGAKGYGNFAIWYNAVLIITAIFSGWITQSTLLFYSSIVNKQAFSKKVLLLSGNTQLILFVPALLIVAYISQDFFLGLLFSLVLAVTCIQFSVLTLIQSNFQSKKIISSEIIRVISYVASAIFFLKLSLFSYLYSLFIAVIVSYSFSLFYLMNGLKIFFRSQTTYQTKIVNPNHIFKSFFSYGAPLSLWFVFAFLLSYVDKLFMLKNLGGEVQGNYQAIFDFLTKSITVAISPIITSLFPILTSAYSKGDNSEIRRLLKKIILYELGGFTITSILYWWFGASLLLHLLKTPDTLTFRLMGFIVIAGTFIWQLAILVQKRFELKLRSLFLLAMVIIAFASQIMFYLLFVNYHSQLLYPLGYLISAIVYLFLISISELVTVSKSLSPSFSRLSNISKILPPD